MFVDGTYRLSLDIRQVTDLGVKIGNEYSDDEMQCLEQEGQFGKLYSRTLEYVLMRPRSQQELRMYLRRKMQQTRSRTGVLKGGYTEALTDRVRERIMQRGYVDDEVFARYWMENRNQRKGTSMRKLSAELRAKGVDGAIIARLQGETERNDKEEIQKIIAKKARRYPDEQKLMQYLARQGFSFDDIKEALENMQD